jgi:hypothetical protein
VQDSLGHVWLALQEPEEFALRWDRGDEAYRLWVWLALAATAVLGTTTYGMTLGISGAHAGPGAMAAKGFLLTVAAGLAWAIPLPALYILNSLAGSRLRPSTTLLAALVTTSWGGLALVASIPINWFFSVAVPPLAPLWISAGAVTQIIRVVQIVVFAGVGLSMVDVFRRVLGSLEPQFADDFPWFLFLVGLIGAQLSYVFNLFV